MNTVSKLQYILLYFTFSPFQFQVTNKQNKKIFFLELLDISIKTIIYKSISFRVYIKHGKTWFKLKRETKAITILESKT